VNIGLDGSEIGVRYQLNNGLPVGTAINGTTSALNFGLFTTPGTYSVIGTYVSTGCANTMSGNALVNVSPLPTAYAVSASNGGHYCAGGVGANVIITNSDPGTIYQVYRGATAVGSSILSGGGPQFFGPFTTPGVYTVKGTDGVTGCIGNMSGSATIVVDPLPTAYTVTGGGGYCAGASGLHVGLSYSTVGVDYQLWYQGTLVNTLHGSGSGLDYGIQTGTGTYSVIGVNSTTGCSGSMSGSATIGINPLPSAYNVTVSGSNSYCTGGAGVNIGTDMSDVGTNYQLYRGTTPSGAAVAGTGGSLSFGFLTTPGTYSVMATNAGTGCMMLQNGTQTVNVNPLPTVYTVTGGGNYCSGGVGVPVITSGSATGVTYELRKNGSGTGMLQSGTGSGLNFGLVTDPGVYTVVATDDATGCVKNMSGSATVGVYSLPTVYNITGGGNYCAGSTGVHIGLDGTSTGVRYQLYNTGGPVGSAMSGTGGSLDFGAQSGSTYSVVATSVLTGCTNTMSGTASVFADPLPTAYIVTGGGSICPGDPGVDIALPMSDATVEYFLMRGGITVAGVGPLTGTGTVLDFGIYNVPGVYTIVAQDIATGCRKNMSGTAAVNVISPTVYSVTGGGSFCAGGTGVHVGQSGSSSSASYQLFIDGFSFGSPVPGTGSSLDFGLQTGAGVYTVQASDNTYGCLSNMGGSATVAVTPLPATYNVTGGGSYCAGGAGVIVDLSNSEAGVNYQLMRGATQIGTAMAGSGATIHFGNQTTAGGYTVVARSVTNGCTSVMMDTAFIAIRPLPTAYTAAITGPNPVYPGYYCAADSGVHIYLPSSDAGVSYQLMRGTTTVGSAVSGTGSGIDFGLQSVAGSYTIMAADAATTCTNNMMGSVAVHIIPLPTVHNVTGGGSYCPGTTGVHIGLDATETGYYYDLMHGTTRSGRLFGTGLAIDFGLRDTVGTYTIVGNNQITECSNNMFGNATVSVETILTPAVTLKTFPDANAGVAVWHIDSMRAYVTTGGSNPTYQWVVNGHIIAGATDAVFTHHEFFNKDSVAVIVTASGPCGGNTTVKSTTLRLITEGINNLTATASDVRLIPNPNKGSFVLKGNTGATATEELTTEVANMLGQVVYTGTITAQNGNVDEHISLNNLANGMYILTLRSATQNTVFHFVVEQ